MNAAELLIVQLHANSYEFMRLVGVLPNPEQATLFGDYLHSLGISARVDATNSQPSIWEIWVRDEDQVDRSKNELDRFVANPTAHEYAAAAGSIGKAVIAERAPPVRSRASVADEGEHSPLVTIGLILMCVVVAFAIPFEFKDEYEHLQQRGLRNQLFFEPSGQAEPFTALRAGEVWRLFTPCLMHGFWTHLIMNMMMLFAYGTVIERRDGSLTMLLLSLFVAAFSNTAQYSVGVFLNRPYPGNFLGMSGVVFGLFGYAWIKTYYARPGDLWDGLVTSQQVYFILIFGLVCVTGVLGPVANTAHFGGLFAGMFWAWVGHLLQKKRLHV
jgi:GlpG protein